MQNVFDQYASLFLWGRTLIIIFSQTGLWRRREKRDCQLSFILNAQTLESHLVPSVLLKWPRSNWQHLFCEPVGLGVQGGSGWFPTPCPTAGHQASRGCYCILEPYCCSTRTAGDAGNYSLVRTLSLPKARKCEPGGHGGDYS